MEFGMGYGFGPGFNVMFTLVPILVGVVFVIVLVTLIAGAVRGAGQWKRNNDSPVLTVQAEIVAKRADVRYYRHAGAADDTMGRTRSSTTYYVTFQVESGDRMELAVPAGEYGLLVEGDCGKLTFQGTRYQGFQRQ